MLLERVAVCAGWAGLCVLVGVNAVSLVEVVSISLAEPPGGVCRPLAGQSDLPGEMTLCGTILVSYLVIVPLLMVLGLAHGIRRLLEGLRELVYHRGSGNFPMTRRNRKTWVGRMAQASIGMLRTRGARAGQGAMALVLAAWLMVEQWRHDERKGAHS